MIKPRALCSNSEIRLVSPASPVHLGQIEPMKQLLEGQGYRVSLGKYAFERDGYLAGSDEHRAADLMEGFEDPAVACVLCSRGGYGSARLMSYLDIPKIAGSRKLFCGFSDITTLHLALNKAGLVTFHTPMALTLSLQREPWVMESFLNLLKGNAAIPDKAHKGTTLVPGVAEGVLTGGCLCLLADSIGTPWQLDAKEKLMLIEDVDEPPHRVDAMLTHLIHAGILIQARGILVGEMTRTDEKIDPQIGAKNWPEIVSERLEPLQIPTILNFPFGHAKNMLSLPLGIPARMDADAGTLTFLEPPCETEF